MSRLKIINLCLLFVVLSGCTQLDAFVDRRREAGAKTPEELYVGSSKPDAPAICYNSWFSSIDEVKELATQECINQKTGNKATPVKQTLFTCKLFLPNHLYFKCEQ